MKIVDVKTFIINPQTGKNLLFVKLTTNDGIVGWGECYTQNDRVLQVASHVEELSRYLEGRDTTNIKRFSYIAYEEYTHKRGSMEFYCALSGIEQAMWDINGKALGVPVYKLMGGKCRDKIRLYANAWYKGCRNNDELADRAMQMVKRGFTAIKFDPYGGDRSTHIEKKDEDYGVERMRVVREAVGPKIDILVENHRRFSPYHAIRLAKRMEEYEPYWFEEPVDSMNIDNLAYVQHHTSLAVVAGETLYSKYEYCKIFEKQAVSVINPDVCSCGGILALKEIAAMAEPYNVVVSPHNYNSTTIGLAATLQISAMIPNFLITEYFYDLEEVGNQIANEPFQVVDGYICLRECPGLGISLKEEDLSKFPYSPFPMRSIPMT